MNFHLFDKLRAHIAGLNPRDFDYNISCLQSEVPGAHDGCGCVAAHCTALIGLPRNHHTSPDMLRRELQLTDDEAQFLYGEEGFGSGCAYAAATIDEFDARRGVKGIAEALRRLDLVASRYTRPTISVDLSETKAADREREFLLRCMAVAAEPVEVE